MTEMTDDERLAGKQACREELLAVPTTKPPVSLADILALPAGSVLDSLIAEQIMGWRKCQTGFWTAIEESKRYLAPGYSHDGDDPDSPVFAPSELISHAWQVVEAMRARGWNFGMEYYNDAAPCPFLGVAAFSIKSAPNYPDGYNTGGICCDTVPLAICQAALLAQIQTRSNPS